MRVLNASSAVPLKIVFPALLVLAGGAASVYGQTLDPFYLSRLEAAQNLILSRNYEGAVKELEIACFGLHADKRLLARAGVLMGFCQVKLSRQDLATAKIEQAAALVGWEALSALAVPGEIKADLEKILSAARDKNKVPAKPPAKPEKAPAVEPEVPRSQAPASNPESARIDELRKIVAADPREAAPRFELAALLCRRNDFVEARRSLRELAAENPAEIRAYLELGRVDYRARSLKEAEKSLEKFLALTPSRPTESRLIDEARALLILSSSLRGDTKKARRAIESAGDLFQPARLAALTLEPKDIDRLLTLKASFEKTK